MAKMTQQNTHYNVICLTIIVVLVTCTSGMPTQGTPSNLTTALQKNRKKSDCAPLANIYITGGGRTTGPQGEKGLRGEPGPQGPAGPAGTGGVSYTCWGRKTCPETEGTELVYEGTTVGSALEEAGSTDYLCLHSQPQFLRTTAGQQDTRGKLYSTEYEPFDSAPDFTSVNRHDVPCSVCYSAARGTKITIPGRISCPASWTKEYHGYLMGATYHAVRGGQSPICVNANPQSIQGTEGHQLKSLLYFYETTCLGIDCPPYSDGAETTCVVCTK